MNRLCMTLIASAGALFSTCAFAGWHTVTVKSMYMVADSAASDPGVRIMVQGTFSPALPCSVQSFFLVPGDPLFKEVYAMLLATQLAGTPVQYYHAYCHASGQSRGSNYISGVE